MARPRDGGDGCASVGFGMGRKGEVGGVHEMRWDEMMEALGREDSDGW